MICPVCLRKILQRDNVIGIVEDNEFRYAIKNRAVYCHTKCFVDNGCSIRNKGNVDQNKLREVIEIAECLGLKFTMSDISRTLVAEPSKSAQEAIESLLKGV